MKPPPQRCLLLELAVFVTTVALVLGPRPALAQHGGGGGHMGGGGGHFGGGGFGSSAHASTRPSRISEPASSRPSAFVRPPTESKPAAGSGESNDGFVLFGPPPAHSTIGFPPLNPATFESASVSFAPPAGPLSFSGQGRQIWPTPAPSATAVTASNARPFTASSITTKPRPPHIIHPPGVFTPYYPLFPAFGFYGFSPFFGYGWGCDPFDWSAFGCDSLGFGYGYGPGGYYAPGWDDNSAPPPPEEDSNDSSFSTWQNPPDENPQSNVAISIPNTVIYFRDGSAYEVTDYWLADNKLHYVTNYGGENAVELSRIDMQRTVDANAARGVNFTLRPGPPPPLNPPPSADGAPPATPQR
jgi:hypothetical protein